MNFFLFWLLTMTNFFIGLLTGIYSQKPEEIHRVINRVRRRLSKEKIGGITKPPPEELVKRGTRLKETEDAVEETLDKIVQ